MLCFDLQIEFDNLTGETLDDKTRELVKFCHRHSRIQELINQCFMARPKVNWMEPVETEALQKDPLYEIYELSKAYNRNRHLPFSVERTGQGDDIAFAMREIAPSLFQQFDVRQWLHSANPGKRLAAIKYLDWLQDIEFLDELLNGLGTERAFVQLHIILVLHSLLDQLNEQQTMLVKDKLNDYHPPEHSSRVFLKTEILQLLEE